MKKMLTFAIGLFIFISTKSQQILLEHVLPELVEENHYEKINLISDSFNNNLYVVMLSKSTMHCVKINLAKLTVEDTITGNISEEDDFEDFYGATVHDDKLSLMYKSRRHDINICTFLFGNKSFFDFFIDPENKNEKVLNGFVWQNKICFLKLIGKKDQKQRHLQINKETDGGMFVPTDFYFNRDELIEKRAGAASLFGTGSLLNDNYQVVKVPAVRARYPNVLNFASFHVKQYCLNDTLIVTEDYDNATEVLEMGMTNSNRASHIFMKEAANEDPDWSDCSNSFLLNDNLFQVKAGQGNLVVTIHNLVDATVKKIFSCTEHIRDFPYQGSYINENHDRSFLSLSRDDKIIDGPASFFSKMKNNPVGITAEKINNSIKLTIGALKIDRSGSWGAYGSGHTYGSVPGPVLTTNAVYFETCLDATTLKNIPQDTLTGNAYNRAEALFGNINDKIDNYSFISANGLEYFCYYNRKKNKIYLFRAEL